jgi:hypothetical protein
MDPSLAFEDEAQSLDSDVSITIGLEFAFILFALTRLVDSI